MAIERLERRMATVSPEFILRPSLSVRSLISIGVSRLQGVAGVYTPAFVERTATATKITRPFIVSPEFILRPSLSGPGEHRPTPRPRRVSPEFILRPSLSVHQESIDQFPPGGECRRSLYSGLR